MIGLAGVSIHSIFVSGRIASATICVSDVSTGVTAIPKRGRLSRTSSAVPT